VQALRRRERSNVGGTRTTDRSGPRKFSPRPSFRAALLSVRGTAIRLWQRKTKLPDKIQKLVRHVNRKDWWHVTPEDPRAYRKRGKFLSSSFGEAEFYGRPNDVPERVAIASPVVGDESTIERKLIGRVESHPDITLRQRFALDAKLRRAALRKGYDSIILMSVQGFKKFTAEGRIPGSLELNVADLRCLSSAARREQG
jgi:hypothetical protein